MANPQSPGEPAAENLVASPLRGERNRMRALFLLAGGVFAISVGINMHVAMNVNFIHELLRASSWQQGYLESIRETMGIVSFLLVALLAGRSEPRVAALMLLVTGLGLAAYSRLSIIPQLVACSLAWSMGFHVWAPLSSSMTLALSRKGREGETMGTLSSVGALGVLIALGGVWLLRVYGGLGMRELFLIGGAVTALGSLPLLFMPPIRARRDAGLTPTGWETGPRRLYLTLEFLDGTRKQIFILFAVLALVREHGVAFQTIAALMFANTCLNFFLAPLAGRLVDRLGERPVLTAYFAGLIVIFILYATVRDVRLLYAVFIADNAIWVLRVGISTYANRLAGRHERTRLLAMGITVNHVGAVALPLVGGALYQAWGYRFPFFCGAAIALASLFVARLVPPRRPGRGL